MTEAWLSCLRTVAVGPGRLVLHPWTSGPSSLVVCPCGAAEREADGGRSVLVLALRPQACCLDPSGRGPVWLVMAGPVPA